MAALFQARMVITSVFWGTFESGRHYNPSVQKTESNTIAATARLATRHSYFRWVLHRWERSLLSPFRAMTASTIKRCL
jgi:choline-glycine betaine transporter